MLLLQSAWRRSVVELTTSTTLRQRTTRQVQRRPFFSFLTGDGPPSPQQEAINDSAQEILKEKERLLLENAIYRLSVQHAHPLGPWKAMSTACQTHHDAWVLARKNYSSDMIHNEETNSSIRDGSSPSFLPPPLFRVLDLACGPRGEPGTTIARLLPLAAVHCTDSCVLSVAEVAVVAAVAEVPAAVVAAVLVSTLENSADEEHNDATKNEDDDRVTGLPLPLPPPNLTKSVLDLSDLIIYPSNTFDAITCCYGYGLAGDLLLQALKEAHRVLVPGGILVICTWEQSAMRLIGRDVLETVRSGGRDMISDENDNDAFFMPRVSHLDPIALSGPGEFEALLAAAGFDGRIVATTGTYPFDLGSNADERFCMGTILVRDELESLGALASSDSVSLEAGGWANLAEEAFWTNIRKYVDVGVMDNTMSLRDNTFKLTVSTKAS